MLEANGQSQFLNLLVLQEVLTQAAVGVSLVRLPELRKLLPAHLVLLANLSASHEIRIVLGQENQTLVLLLVQYQLEQNHRSRHEPFVLRIPGQVDVPVAELQGTDAPGPHVQVAQAGSRTTHRRLDALPVTVVYTRPHGQDVHVEVGRVLLGVVEVVGSRHQVTLHEVVATRT